MITTGRVGVGSAAPSVALDIVGTTKVGVLKQGGIIFGDINRGVTYSGTGSFSGTAVFASSFPTDGPVIYGWVDGALGTTGGGANNIALSWLYTGQVGIGITNPTFPLSVQGAQSIYGTSAQNSLTTTSGNLMFYTSGDSYAYPTMNLFQYNHDNCALTFDMYLGSAGWLNATTGTGFMIYKVSNSLRFYYQTGTPGTTGTNTLAMMINSSGQLGIGTATPSQTLHVYGDGARTRIESVTASNAVLELKTKTNISYLFTDQSGHFQIYPASTSNHVLLQPSGGNVGIGTATINYALQIGTVGSIIRIGGLTNQGSAADTTTYGLERSRNQIQFSGYRDALTDKVGAKIVAINKQTYGSTTLRQLIQSTDLAFFTVPPDTADLDNTVERMRITDMGYVGIGTAAPTSQIHLHGTAGSGYWSNSCLRITNGISTADSIANGTSIQLQNGYNAYYFNIMTYGYAAGGSSSSFYIHSDNGIGVVLSRGSNTWSVYSDSRMKIDVTPLPSELSNILKLKPVSYLYDIDPSENVNIVTRVGFLADEVFTIYPNLVTKDSGMPYTNQAGETFVPMTMCMTDLIPYHTKAIQELASQATSHATHIQELEQELASQATSYATHIQELEQKIDTLSASHASLSASHASLLAWAQTQGFSM